MQFSSATILCTNLTGFEWSKSIEAVLKSKSFWKERKETEVDESLERKKRNETRRRLQRRDDRVRRARCLLKEPRTLWKVTLIVSSRATIASRLEFQLHPKSLFWKYVKHLSSGFYVKGEECCDCRWWVYLSCPFFVAPVSRNEVYDVKPYMKPAYMFFNLSYTCHLCVKKRNFSVTGCLLRVNKPASTVSCCVSATFSSNCNG